ncbi:GMP/IMP nucleotidase [Allohahella marinimesophila]|uniref:GMP/IMP nucleotidase n=1 Tax=Allohahella marinimesophila TaxID=1054972 RepID=A0ABP7PIR6_9GAMM
MKETTGADKRPDWSEIETVLLDMDGTLLDLNYDNHFWMEHLPLRYAQIHQQEPTEARRHVTALIQAQRGTLNWYCLDYWSETLDVDITALKREIGHLIQYRPGTERLLQFLQSLPASAYIVTNAHRAGLEIKLEAVGLGQYFSSDRIISSHDYGEPKEADRFWTHLQQALNFQPSHTMFIDDNVQVLEAAAAHGIRHLYGIAQPDSRGQVSDEAYRRISKVVEGSNTDSVLVPMLTDLGELIPESSTTSTPTLTSDDVAAGEHRH